MAGVANITNEILQDAKEKAEALLRDAKWKADTREAAVKAELDAEHRKVEAKAEQEAAAYAERVISQADMKKRLAVLKTKQSVIDEVIETAYKKLAAQDDASYFQMLLTLIGRHVQKGQGSVLLSARDLDRLPEGFAKEVSAIAEKQGGSLQILKEAAAIDNGFVLRYGGIDENCTLKALFEEKRDALTDKVQEVLW